MTDRDTTVERDARPKLFGLDLRIKSTAYLKLPFDTNCSNFDGFFEIRRQSDHGIYPLFSAALIPCNAVSVPGPTQITSSFLLIEFNENVLASERPLARLWITSTAEYRSVASYRDSGFDETALSYPYSAIISTHQLMAAARRRVLVDSTDTRKRSLKFQFLVRYPPPPFARLPGRSGLPYAQFPRDNR